ncbi:unnamed protein product [Clonostachys byssicola]|uniref:Carboxylic ester hydrolase n=1 Tax=Clonostachys byssicola TaxID=160290 RepID=A0A9N9U5H9_9HYPO|nr:unnamed protein product [Clonostachys byssicola]
MENTPPWVQIAQGIYIGTILTLDLPRSIEAFQGIPYAKPPIGNLRFRPPEKVEVSSNTYDATRLGPAAPGKQLLPGSAMTYSEDCLTVNIYRVARVDVENATGLLPVVVYFHAGAFNRGTSSSHNTASMLAWSSQPFVAVSFNYRLGALGFLPSTATANQGLLNLGLKDQIALLDWVQENIASFGGNPLEVTLMGLSAGAHSQQFAEFLCEVGSPENASDDEIFDFLRSVPLEVITQAQETIFDRYNTSLRWAFQPVIDGEIIRRPPLDTWRLGLWHKMPILTGFCRNEGSLYVNKSMQTSSQFNDFFGNLLPKLSKADNNQLKELYPDPTMQPRCQYVETRSGVGAQYKRVEAAYAHYAYVAPVRQTANFASAAMTQPVYLYQWAAVSSELNGARHGDNKRVSQSNSKFYTGQTSLGPV